MIALLLLSISRPTDSVDSRVETLLSKMTLEEKVSLCHGGSAFATKAIPRLGIPAWEFSDGPHGLRRSPDPTTAFPTGVSFASTWNPNLIYKVGEALGEESKALNLSVLLGPAVNIVRTPIGGRSFEYLSEDPYLAGKLGVQWIKGIQSKGVGASLKHFAFNSIENDRMDVSAEVDERTAREIYLPAFEMAIKEAQPWTVMNAYNKWNGIYCGSNTELLDKILRKDWGFKGYVMSDWGAIHEMKRTALAGMDLEMPGYEGNFLGDPLLAAVKSGEVPVSAVESKVRNILRTMLAYKAPTEAEKKKINTKEHQALALETARESIVLLKNKGNLLPLDRTKLKSIAVIGPMANAKNCQGGGSSQVTPPYEITPLEGLKKKLGNTVKINYELGCTLSTEEGTVIPSTYLKASGSGEPGLTAEYFSNTKLEGTPVVTQVDKTVDFDWTGGPVNGIGHTNFSVRWTGQLTPPKTGVYRLGTTSDDGSRLYVDGKLVADQWLDHATTTQMNEIRLTAGQPVSIVVEYYQGGGDANMKLVWQEPRTQSMPKGMLAAIEAARKSDVAIVYVGTGHAYDSEGGDKPNLSLPGFQNLLIEAVHLANPKTIVVLSTGSAVEMFRWGAEVPAIVEDWYGGLEIGNASADVLFGDVNPSGKLPLTFPNRLADIPAHQNGNYPPVGHVLKYDEGIFVGYRHFDTHNVAPNFPFGHGLSYTSFEYKNIKISQRGSKVVVTATITNTGPKAGAEVVQLYVHDEKPEVARPTQELKGFQKVKLAPGASSTVKFELDSRAFAYWSTEKHDWVAPKGNFEIRLGSSSRDIRLSEKINR